VVAVVSRDGWKRWRAGLDWVAWRCTVEGAGRAVLWAVAYNVDRETGLATLSTRTIARQAGISRRHLIQAVLPSLVESGDLEIKELGRGTRPSTYRLPRSGDPRSSQPEGPSGYLRSPQEQSEQEPVAVTSADASGYLADPVAVTSAPGTPLIGFQERHSGSQGGLARVRARDVDPAAPTPDTAPPTDDYLAAFTAWVRATRNQSYTLAGETERELRQHLADFARRGLNPAAVGAGLQRWYDDPKKPGPIALPRYVDAAQRDPLLDPPPDNSPDPAEAWAAAQAAGQARIEEALRKAGAVSLDNGQWQVADGVIPNLERARQWFYDTQGFDPWPAGPLRNTAPAGEPGRHRGNEPEGRSVAAMIDRGVIPDRPPRGPDEHKQFLKRLGLSSVTELLVLHRNNDPFYQGLPFHWRDGRWFAGLWERFGYTNGVHLRRVHYQAVTLGVQTATGEPYSNTEHCWRLLARAGAFARMLGLVDPEAFVDRRNTPPVVNVSPRWEQPEPSWSWLQPWAWEPPLWELPAIGPSALDVELWELPAIRSWELERGASGWFRWPDPDVAGYDYDPADQPVLLEVWVEKSTMDDVLGPLCRDLRANLLSGTGFESHTAVIALLRRAQRHHKPAHVLYVADFDPAGVVMPIAVARQAQFYRETLRIDAELTIEQVALTGEQVDAYDLPRVPIKESDTRAAGFEARNGTGAVELDALEALHPGTLAGVVRDAAQPYIDATLNLRLSGAERQARSEAASALATETGPIDERLEAVKADVPAVTDGYRARLRTLAGELVEAMAPYRARLEELRAEVDTAAAPYRARLAALADELDAELAPHRERLEELSHQAARTVEEFDVALPERPEPATPDVDRSRLLFDSERHWWDQLQVFKDRQAAEDDP
jgi:hypothetical protein